MKVKPTSISNFVKKPLKKINSNKKVSRTIIDITPDDRGFYRVGDKFVKVIFPR